MFEEINKKNLASTFASHTHTLTNLGRACTYLVRRTSWWWACTMHPQPPEGGWAKASWSDSYTATTRLRDGP